MPAAETPQDLSALIVFLTSGADLGRAVLAGRERLGESQAALARRCRVGRKFLRELEAGKASVRLDKALLVLYAVGMAGLLVPMEMVRGAVGK
jgi:HTH-type transcriptional regulator/antitoxin HipB